jgi:hypothetical protein
MTGPQPQGVFIAAPPGPVPAAPAFGAPAAPPWRAYKCVSPAGVGYRCSKNVEDRGPRGPDEGKIVYLAVDGDWGKEKWSGLYLPLRKDGKVLFEPANVIDAPPASTTPASGSPAAEPGPSPGKRLADAIESKAAEAALLTLVTPEACTERGELGQLALHFATMSAQPSLELVSHILAANPEAASARNDFGMLPLVRPRGPEPSPTPRCL